MTHRMIHRSPRTKKCKINFGQNSVILSIVYGSFKRSQKMGIFPPYESYMKRTTSPRTPRISGLKSQVLKPTFFSELPANLSGQFSLSWQIFFALGSRESEGAPWISKNKSLDRFTPSKLSSKVLFIFRCSKNWQKKSVHHHL